MLQQCENSNNQLSDSKSANSPEVIFILFKFHFFSFMLAKKQALVNNAYGSSYFENNWIKSTYLYQKLK